MTTPTTTVCAPAPSQVPDAGTDHRHLEGAGPQRRHPAPEASGGATIAAGIMVLVCVLARLPDRMLAATGIRGWAAGLVGVVAMVNGARILAQAPFTYARRSTSARRWAVRQLATLGGTVAFGSILTVALYALIRASSLWWLWAWVLFAAVTVAGQAAMPLVIRAQSGPLAPAPPPVAQRLCLLGALAGVDMEPTVRIAAPRKGRVARHNAYVVGFGRRRQVVLEAGVAAWPLALIDQVVAHEIGHWRLGHTRRRLPITILAQLATFALAAEALSLRPLLHWGGVTAAGDPRSYPLLLALTVFVALPARLVLSAYDRAHERAADRFALELLAAPTDFMAMLDRAARDGGAARHLPWWRRVMASHPSIDDRILACQSILVAPPARSV